jgi:two-component system nitrogen regulation response regulator GlnG
MEQEPNAGVRERLLVADDDLGIRLVLRHSLESAGYDVEEAADSQSTLRALRTGKFDAALVDIIMPGDGGLEVLSSALSEGIRTPIVIVTAASTMNNAVEAMRRGAYDYLTKPFANLEHVVSVVKRAVGAHTRVGRAGAAPPIPPPQLPTGELVGRSPAMQEVYKLIGRLVNNDANVFIEGETGTGKELVARAIHFRSHRRSEPFVAVNCAAIPQGLLESELFGHERGSFTGASERRLGKFELAGGGALFLDEIADLPLELQPKLLRVLQEREFSRVGGAEPLHLRARIIAASNQPLEGAVAARRFREDLYYRLRVIPIWLPPLRERREDIPELTDYFLAQAAREMGTKALAVSPQARALLASYRWPGNVRELENCVLRAALLAPGDTIRVEDIVLSKEMLSVRAPAPPQSAPSLRELITRRIRDQFEELGDDEMRDLYPRMLADFEHALIELVLEYAGGNQVKTARILGLNRNTLRKKIIEHKIVPRKASPA